MHLFWRFQTLAEEEKRATWKLLQKSKKKVFPQEINTRTKMVDCSFPNFSLFFSTE